MDAELQYYKDKERQANAKLGVLPENKDQIEEDLSQKTPNQSLQRFYKQIQHSLKSLFNIFL